MAGPSKRKDEETDSGGKMKAVRKEEKREGGGYNWCFGRDVFMLHWLRGPNEERGFIPTKSDQSSCIEDCYSIFYVF